MKPMTLVLFAGLLISGCVHRHVTVVSGREDAGAWRQDEPRTAPDEEVDGAAYEDDGSANAEDDPALYAEEGCEPAWDGHAWIEFSAHSHGPDCGHFFYRDCWNLYPENHVFVEVGYAPCRETGGFFYRGDPWARVWDGVAFLMLRGHVHGADCGHSYHDGCWNVFPRGHVYSERGHRDFCASPPRARHERPEGRRDDRHEARRDAGRGESRMGRAEPVVRGHDGEAGGSSRRVEARPQGPARPAQPARVEAGARGGEPRRFERPAKSEAPERVERPVNREAPERIERQEKREAPERIERPEKREAPERIERQEKREAPERIERQEKREAPERIERQEKREAPQRIEKPEKHEAPQRIEKREPPQKKEQTERREEPRKHEAPKQPERPKKR